MRLKSFLYLFLALSLCHCASVSTLQTGRVLDEGESSHAIGLGTYSSDDFLGGSKISLPLLEYSYRRGMWEDIDVGVKLAIIGSLNLDMKYNFVNGEKFAMATGIGLGYLDFESTTGTTKSKATILDFVLPLYLSYDVGDMTTLYGAGKYILRTVSSDLNVSSDGSMASTSLGVKVGKTSGMFLEGSLITGLGNSFSGTQFNAAYFFEL